NPICSARAGRHVAASAKQQALVRAAERKRRHAGEALDHSLISRTKIIYATIRPIRNASRVRTGIDPPTTRVAREKSNVQSLSHCAAEILIHRQRVIFVVANRKEAFSPAEAFWLDVSVEVGNVNDVVALCLHPKGQWEL